MWVNPALPVAEIMVDNQKDVFGTILGAIEAHHLPVACWHYMQKHCLPWSCDNIFFAGSLCSCQVLNLQLAASQESAPHGVCKELSCTLSLVKTHLKLWRTKGKQHLWYSEMEYMQKATTFYDKNMSYTNTRKSNHQNVLLWMNDSLPSRPPSCVTIRLLAWFAFGPIPVLRGTVQKEIALGHWTMNPNPGEWDGQLLQEQCRYFPLSLKWHIFLPSDAISHILSQWDLVIFAFLQMSPRVWTTHSEGPRLLESGCHLSLAGRGDTW